MKAGTYMVTVGAVLAMGVLAWAALPAPENLSATVGTDDVLFDWDPVEGATKYSVDVCATVQYSDGLPDGLAGEAEVCVSFGTSDRTDGGDMADDYLSVSTDELIDAIVDALIAQGVDPAAIGSLEIAASAKVKALAPGKGAGRQNNPFSDPADFALSWSAPTE